MTNMPQYQACWRIAALLGLFTCSFGTNIWAQSDATHPVLLISVDGLHPDYVFDAQPRGLKLPVLQRLIDEGTSARSVKNITPTVTIPNHTTLVTGTVASSHGAYDNLVFDPLRQRLNQYFWYAQDIKSTTLWDVVKAQGAVVASLYWPGTVGADSIAYNIPLYWRDQSLEDVKQIGGLSTTGLVTELQQVTGFKLADSVVLTPAADQIIGKYAEHVLRTRKPRLMTVHLSAYDHAAHVSGPDSADARAALENTDAVIGSIISAGREALPELVVAVVSDHGFAPLHHDVNLLRPFVDAGLSKVDAASGRFVSWDAMPWGYAAAAVFLARPADQVLQTRTAALLASLATDPSYHIDKIVDLTSSVAFKTGRSPAFYVGFEAGYEMGQSLEAAKLTASTYKGMHGYLNDMPAMNSAFFIAGPSIPKGSTLGVIDMLDIAPTLAAILGTRLPDAPGKSLLSK